MNTDMKGIFTALLTPFDKNDNVNEKELEKLNETLNKTGSTDYSGAALLAAARANYKIALIRRSGNSVTSFSAGDIKISENNSELENAKALLDEVSSECAALADVNGFAFRTV